VEFAGELSDLIRKDLSKVDNDRAVDMRWVLLRPAVPQPSQCMISHGEDVFQL
jgi:hypothetical protein